MRKPLELVKRQKSIHVFTFQMVIGGKVAAMLINPIMWILTIVYFTQKGSVGMVIEEFFPPPILYMGVVALIVGNFLYMYYYMIGCAKRGKYSIMKYVFLVPFYWLAISVASYFALYKLVVNPHYWSKTKHGLHIKDPSVTSSYQLGFK